MLDPGLTARLSHQLVSFRAFVADAGDRDLAFVPASGKWSALQNLAHVGRHHEIMLERLERILAEEAPAFPSYREADDPGWAAWEALPPARVWARLAERRAALLAWAGRLTPAGAARTGVHARFGPMDVARWLEFFLVHEAHHLYVALLRLAEARAARA
jgi:DinB family protein